MFFSKNWPLSTKVRKFIKSWFYTPPFLLIKILENRWLFRRFRCYTNDRWFSNRCVFHYSDKKSLSFVRHFGVRCSFTTLIVRSLIAEVNFSNIIVIRTRPRTHICQAYVRLNYFGLLWAHIEKWVKRYAEHELLIGSKNR